MFTLPNEKYVPAIYSDIFLFLVFFQTIAS